MGVGGEVVPHQIDVINQFQSGTHTSRSVLSQSIVHTTTTNRKGKRERERERRRKGEERERERDVCRLCLSLLLLFFFGQVGGKWMGLLLCCAWAEHWRVEEAGTLLFFCLFVCFWIIKEDCGRRRVTDRYGWLNLTTTKKTRCCRSYIYFSVIGMLVVYNLVANNSMGSSSSSSTLTLLREASYSSSTASSTTVTTASSTTTTATTKVSYVVHTCLHPAGLLDRQEVISKLLELTQYLQALANGNSNGYYHHNDEDNCPKQEESSTYRRKDNDYDYHHHHLYHIVKLEFSKPRQAFHTMHNNIVVGNHDYLHLQKEPNNASTGKRKWWRNSWRTRGNKLDRSLQWNDFWYFRPTKATYISTDTLSSLLLGQTTQLAFDPIFYYQLQLKKRRNHPGQKYCRSPRRWKMYKYKYNHHHSLYNWYLRRNDGSGGRRNRRNGGGRSSSSFGISNNENNNSSSATTTAAAATVTNGGGGGGSGGEPNLHHNHHHHHDDDDDRTTTTIHLISTTPEEVIEHFDFLRHYMMTMQQKKKTTTPLLRPNDNNNDQPLFVWEIAVNFYSFHKQMIQHLQKLDEKQKQKRKQQQQQQQHLLLSSNYTNCNSSSTTTTKKKGDIPIAVAATPPFIPWIRRSEKYVEQVLPPRIIKLIDDAWKQVVSSVTTTTNDDNDGGGGGGDDDDAVATASNTVSSDKSNNSKNTKNETNESSFVTGFLHIRRGDTQHECDTSIPKLRTYLNCSLHTMRLKQKVISKLHPNRRQSDNNNNNSEDDDYKDKVKNKIDMILLVSTNERDPSYVQSVQTMISNELSPLRVDHSIEIDDSPSDHHQAITNTTRTTTTTIVNIIPINGEELVWSTLTQAVHHKKTIPKSYLNNFHVFMILQQLKNMVDVKNLQQRRIRQCKDCDDVGTVVLHYD